MQPQPLENRVERLEQRVTILEHLPARVEGLAMEISQLRDEMRAEFSAMRGGANADVTLGTLRQEIRAGDEETRRTLREEIRMGDEETRRYMRVLHEDVIARLAIIQEGQRPRKKR